jgi:hypothetical protein
MHEARTQLTFVEQGECGHADPRRVRLQRHRSMACAQVAQFALEHRGVGDRHHPSG